MNGSSGIGGPASKGPTAAESGATLPPPIVGWMSTLGDPTRARILRAAERHELTVAELCRILQSPQSTVSRHLKILSEDGWLTARPEGTSRLYRMVGEDVEPAALRLWGLVREQTASTPAGGHDDQRLEHVIEERRARSQEFFSSTAGQWDRMREDLFGTRFDLEALAALLAGDWVVGDLGCGTGQMAAAVAPFVGRVIAVESSLEMIDAARVRLAVHDNVVIRSGNLESLPIDDGALDAATMSLVLHHVAEPARALAEAARVLKPGARLLLIDMYPHERSEYRDQMGHVWLGFEPDRIATWLDDAGFTDVRVRALTSDSSAKGPALFAAAATLSTKPSTTTTGSESNGSE
jgi:SAM-dependent methyltransferase